MIWVSNSALLIRGKYLPDTWDLLGEIQYLHKTSKKVFFHRFYLECYIQILIKIILIETHEILWFLKNTFRICTLNKDIENLRVATVKSGSQGLCNNCVQYLWRQVCLKNVSNDLLPTWALKSPANVALL